MQLTDIFPPLLVRVAKRMRSRLFASSQAGQIQPIEPFFSPAFHSHSQFQEDLLIDVLLGVKSTGFYLDVGANDPSFNSNTKRFYDRGWSGINIEPGGEAFSKLNNARERDINLNIGVAAEQGTLSFYEVVGDGTLSSFDQDIAQAMARKFNLEVAEASREVLPLVKVFEKFVGERPVDFMSVDTEGLDIAVLKSNDWSRFRPSLVLVELDRHYDEAIDYMAACDYELLFNNYHNGIFLDRLTQEHALQSLLEGLPECTLNDV